MAKKDFGGCCGHPPSCDQAGRCKFHEDFYERKRSGRRRSIDDVTREQLTREQFQRIMQASRERSQRERKQERGGRELTR